MTRDLFRLLACGDIMKSRGDLRFVTLTFEHSGLPLDYCAHCWREFTNGRWWRSLSRGKDRIQVWEIHPGGHGWHLHMLVNFFIPWKRLQREIVKAGFGYIVHVELCRDMSVCDYVCKYLLKSKRISRSESARRHRIINVSRSLLPLSDVNVKSSSIDYVRSRWRFTSGPLSLRWRMLYLRWLSSFSLEDIFYGDY